MSVLMDMHQDHVARRKRLMNGHQPVPRPVRQRPVSPFVREVVERRAAAAKAAADEVARLERARANRENSGPHWSRIVAQVAKKHKLHPRDLSSSSRNKAIVAARYEAFYRMRTEILIGGLPMSFPAIGRRFGGMDHTSVLHGFRKHAAMIGADVSVRAGLARLYQNPGIDGSIVDGRTRNYSMEDRHQTGKAVQ